MVSGNIQTSALKYRLSFVFLIVRGSNIESRSQQYFVSVCNDGHYDGHVWYLMIETCPRIPVIKAIQQGHYICTLEGWAEGPITGSNPVRVATQAALLLAELDRTVGSYMLVFHLSP